MKKYLSHICVAGSLLSMSACSNKLDQVVPDTQITYQQLNSTNLPLVIGGAKLSLTSNNAFYLYYDYQDIMTDDLQSVSLPSWEACNVTSLDNTLTFMFKQPYAAIANVNMILKYAGEHASDTTIRSTVGEAYLLRAYSYMMLSEHFGGVPLVYGNEDPKTRAVRKTLAEVNQQIETDLLQAASLSPDYTNPTTGSKQAAQLLLARLYLNLGRNDDALTMANAVLNSGKLTLTSNFGDIFKSAVNSTEALYKVNETNTGGSNMYGLPTVLGPGKNGGTNVAGSGNTWADSNLVKSYDPTDIRKSFYQRTKGGSIIDSVYFVMKFPQELSNSYPVCRYSEAYLIVAEATARKGTVDVTRYNQLRTARKASTRNNSDFASPAAFLAEIEQERRREFIGERLRWQDMARFGKRDAWIQSFGQPVTHALLPLPSREFSINPYLDQNPDYTK
ncbi:SusD-like starch-binding protein associating with outer membrane [Chitinophaga dinghuensis]|uniref:SusD-like starch-binding protein associating with outer membrane n=1 Tax=Chitinophaga dinghuensis TaxID=1539050 RepID=A0A327VU53_9BACT|nr:RagB/SusD family nutrient uptake outer membrane protein [Chitinophaga dinghuensis]RAJ77478.1 SusD-like starch-binding protein associating with outer membrane [Chitinophaga dinghuensis]